MGRGSKVRSREEELLQGKGKGATRKRRSGGGKKEGGKEE